MKAEDYLISGVRDDSKRNELYEYLGLLPIEVEPRVKVIVEEQSPKLLHITPESGDIAKVKTVFIYKPPYGLPNLEESTPDHVLINYGPRQVRIDFNNQSK